MGGICTKFPIDEAEWYNLVDPKKIKDPKLRMHYTYDRRYMPAFIFCRSFNHHKEIVGRLNKYFAEGHL
jgi:hypothetical protein